MLKTANEGKIYQLENRISQLKSENSLLRKELTIIKTSFNNMESEYTKIKTMYNSIVSKENVLKIVEEKLKEKEELIDKLRKDIEKINVDKEKQRVKFELQYEKDVAQAKYQHENNLAKVENATKIEKFCENLYQVNVKYEKIIKTFEEEEKRRVQEREVLFEKQMNDLKKKMLDYIKDGQKNGKVFNSAQANLNNKLTFLHNNQLLTELEFQSLQIEDLLRQREHLDKVILSQKNDIKVHKEVERALGKKNKKYTNMIRILSNKLDDKLDFASSGLTKSNSTINLNKDKTILLQKELSSQKKELSDIKFKYEILKNNVKMNEKRYGNVVQLLEDALYNIYKDEKFEKFKELYVNVDDFKKCEFDTLNEKQKYSLLVMLIKRLLPLLDVSTIDNDPLLRSLEKVRTKFIFSGENSTKTFSSFGETKASFNSFKHLKFKSCDVTFHKSPSGDNIFNFSGKSDKRLYSLLKVK